jgi:FkbM family methyltransferase
MRSFSIFLLLRLLCFEKAGAAIVSSALRGKSNATQSRRSLSSQAPCHCKPTSASWKRPARTTPTCVFVDLGSGVGDDLEAFVSNKFGPVENCPNGKWQAFLVEANPSFESPLRDLADKYPDSVHVMASQAAYMCEATAEFYVDSKEKQSNYWGISIYSDHPDAISDTLEKVSVSTVNINRLLTENTIPGDYVIVSMDLEGAEFDVIPCMAESPSAVLIDRLYIEQHDPSWGLETSASSTAMSVALAGLRTRGVDLPGFYPPGIHVSEASH